ncbi:citrate/2-methylcitrate synthase [Nonomuraea roseola]|uniref:citrate synthase (unknown stereospecificity) n=1 Tax=Nonomuraea roseola TaxID=46179 RepID=A0ABV5PUW2_9ACTN
MEWIDAATAAERLGVKPATLYAYVSRGVLRRRHGEDGRRSFFDAAEIEQLARRGRPRNPPPELVIESAITALGVDRPYYRGIDALDLARRSPFEAVAAWLWGVDEEDALPPWQGDPEGIRAAAEAQGSLPEGLLPLDRLQVITTVLGATDSLRYQLDPASVAATGRRLIAGLVDALPAQPGVDAPATRLGRGAQETSAMESAATSDATLPGVSRRAGDSEDHPPSVADGGSPGNGGSEGGGGSGGGLPSGGLIAARLWGRLTPHAPDPALLSALQAALVLLADHELAASTLAARVAASAKADPYAVVLTALGVLGGPLHGGASYGAERLLAEVAEPSRASRVITERVRRGERIPGFGHSVYKNGDSRATVLFEILTHAAPGHPALDVAQAVRKELRRRRLPDPNIDFALATLTSLSGMVPGAGEAIFAVARTAGWLAHAMEEYAKGTLLRPRASYIGPPPR